MKKLFTPIFIGSVLIGCGDSYGSLTPSDIAKIKSTEEGVKIGKWVAESFDIKTQEYIKSVVLACSMFNAKDQRCNMSLSDLAKSAK